MSRLKIWDAVSSTWKYVSGAFPVDIDGTMVANSDLLLPSQKAVKLYVDGKQVDASNRIATQMFS